MQMRKRGNMGAMVFTHHSPDLNTHLPPPPPSQQPVRRNSIINMNMNMNININNPTIHSGEPQTIPHKRGGVLSLQKMMAETMRTNERIVSHIDMNRVYLIEVNGEMVKSDKPPPMTEEEISIEKSKSKNKSKKKRDPPILYFHLDASLDIEEIARDWSMIEMTGDDTIGSLLPLLKDENTDIYRKTVGGKTYFHFPTNKEKEHILYFHRPLLSLHILHMTVFCVFILEENREDYFPHLITAFRRRAFVENPPFDYHNIVFQLFHDALSDSFHINSSSYELWSDHSFPPNIPVLFTMTLETDEDGVFTRKYRINGLDCGEIEYTNFNGYMISRSGDEGDNSIYVIGEEVREQQCNNHDDIEWNDEIMIGGNNIENGGWNGLIGEVLLYQSCMDEEEVVKKERELAGKWGVEWKG